MIFSTHEERDELGGGRIRSTIHMKRIAHRYLGSLRRNVDDWAAGDATFPHVILGSSMLAYWKDAAIRLCPTRDPQVYFEFGRPKHKPAGSWVNLPLALPTRAANTLTSVNANYDVSCVMAGFKADLWDFEFKNGWTPTNSQLAFKVGMQGMTRQGADFLVDGVPQLTLRAPHVYDAENPLSPALPVTWIVAPIGGEPHVILTLPNMAGLQRPCLDPTLTLQPDATDGVDTIIDAVLTNQNYGIWEGVQSGELSTASSHVQRGLLKFTLTTIPATATISSATQTLTLILAGNERASNNRAMQVYPVLRAWVEGNKNNADDTPASGATWVRYDTTNNWATAGCGNTTTDREATSVGSHTFQTTDAQYSTHDFSWTASKVQEWTSGALTNNGVLLQMDTENNDAYRFASSDHATASYRPKLVVEYTLPSSGSMASFAGPRVGAFIH